MKARWANAARRERIPRRSASAIEVFGMLHVPTNPGVTSPRSPFAQRASNARHLDVIGFVIREVREILGLIAKPQAPEKQIVTPH